MSLGGFFDGPKHLIGVIQDDVFQIRLQADAGIVLFMQSFLSVSKGSDVEADVQDVSILDPIFFSFQAEQSLFADGFL